MIGGFTIVQVLEFMGFYKGPCIRVNGILQLSMFKSSWDFTRVHVLEFMGFYNCPCLRVWF